MGSDELDRVYERIRESPRFAGLRLEASERFVPGEGSTATNVFIVGEAPGAQEAERLRPFVGPSGKLLRALMHKAGLYTWWHGRLTGAQVLPHCREGIPPNCWLTNVLKYRPTGNRTPTLHEITVSRAYLRREWMAVGWPKIIVPVGAPALKAVMPDFDASITFCAGQRINAKLRGRRYNVMVFPMVHPQYILRSGDAAMDHAVADWTALGKFVRSYG